MRKPIQITENKLVICDDGSMWGWHWPTGVKFPIWERLPDIPQDDEVKYEKATV